ncbi:MAG: hypothetical protein JNL70_04155 [Saprospiraceae bacterium]|nr:hypothetical protein [Saprospiraceae bacterium]
MNFHGSSKQNTNPHHLYEIRDNEIDDTFKYGISAEPIAADGLSKRMRVQLSFLNLVAGYQRYTGHILIENIPDRVEAWRLEDEYIETYKSIFGFRPKGNLE